jgi:hypothetical protein
LIRRLFHHGDTGGTESNSLTSVFSVPPWCNFVVGAYSVLLGCVDPEDVDRAYATPPVLSYLMFRRRLGKPCPLFLVWRRFGNWMAGAVCGIRVTAFSVAFRMNRFDDTVLD